MLAKLNVPAHPEVGPTAAMIGAARTSSNEEWESDYDVTFNIVDVRRAKPL